MKKKTVEIGPPQVKFEGVDPDGRYMIAVRFKVTETDNINNRQDIHYRGIGIYIDPEKIWMMTPSCQTPYVDAKFYEVVNAPTYKEQFDQYYDEVEVIRLEEGGEEEKKEDNKDGMIVGYDGKKKWL